MFVRSPGMLPGQCTQEYLVGIVLSFLAALVSYRHLSSRGLRNFSLHRILWVLAYMPVLIWAMIKANLDVAYRVLHPRMPIKPGIVRIRTDLKNPLAKLVLANSITLTPGTMTLQIMEDRYYIHWIYVRSDDEKVAGEYIKGEFEKYIREAFDDYDNPS